MKDLFSWRLRPSEAEFIKLWDTATFVFDTNFLLNLYRVSRHTSDDYFRILQHLQDRIWLPYQVADEFLERREGVIAEEVGSFGKAVLVLEEWINEQQSLKSLQGKLNQTGRIIASEISSLFNQQNAYATAVKDVEEIFRGKIEELRNAHSSLNAEDDDILDKIFLLFDKKVGEPYSSMNLQNLYKEGEARYRQLIPPGFRDDKKLDDRKYGDFILWKQILDFAKAESRPIIFVTGDCKEDWWIKEHGKKRCPRMELRYEFQEFVRQPFWMYPTRRFLEIAQEKLMVKIDPKSIEETETISELESIPQQIYEILKEQKSKESKSPDEITQQVIEQLRLQSPDKITQQVIEQLRLQSPDEITQQVIEQLRLHPKLTQQPAEQLLRVSELLRQALSVSNEAMKQQLEPVLQEVQSYLEALIAMQPIIRVLRE